MLQQAMQPVKKDPRFGGGFSGFQQPAQAPANPAQAQMNALNAQYPSTGGAKWVDMKKQLAYAAQPNVLHGMNFLNQMQPQHLNMIKQALSALNPNNRMGRVADYRRDAMGQGLDMANQQVGMLGANSGALANALRMGAMNNAQQAGNEYMFQQYSPEQDVRNAQAASALLDPATVTPLMDRYMQWLQEGQANKPKSSGGLGGVLGTLSNLAASAAELGWSPL
jgi:hypothetical protein